MNPPTLNADVPVDPRRPARSWERWVLAAAMGAVMLLLTAGGAAAYVATYERLTTVTQTFTCDICHQDWARASTTLRGYTIWTRGGRHTTPGHVATYQGGGQGNVTWTVFGGPEMYGCGGQHSLRSP